MSANGQGLAQWHPCSVSRALHLTWKLMLKLTRFPDKGYCHFCEFLRNGHSWLKLISEPKDQNIFVSQPLRQTRCYRQLNGRSGYKMVGSPNDPPISVLRKAGTEAGRCTKAQVLFFSRAKFRKVGAAVHPCYCCWGFILNYDRTSESGDSWFGRKIWEKGMTKSNCR